MEHATVMASHKTHVTKGLEDMTIAKMATPKTATANPCISGNFAASLAARYPPTMGAAIQNHKSQAPWVITHASSIGTA